MINEEIFFNSSLGKALKEFCDYLKKNDLKYSFNVVGGFAMICHGLRDASIATDIDYIGPTLPKDIQDIINVIGAKYNLEKDFINNDLLLPGSSLEELELSTGPLSFIKVYEEDGLTINCLCKEDLLRMKLISIDTALTAIELGGDFSRTKDLPDIIKLMDDLNVGVNRLEFLYSEYIDNDNTLNLIKEYKEKGKDHILPFIKQTQDTYMQQLNFAREKRKEYKTSDYINNLLEETFKKVSEHGLD